MSALSDEQRGAAASSVVPGAPTMGRNHIATDALGPDPAAPAPGDATGDDIAVIELTERSVPARRFYANLNDL